MNIKNFLIVDDHSLSGKGAASEIRIAFPGVEVEIRKTVHGEDGAIAYLSSMRASCVVLTDLHFDDEGSEAGMELLEHVRDRYPHILPVVLSAETDGSVIKRCMALGARAYLTKGGDTENMGKIIAEVVAGGTYFPEQAETELSAFMQAYENLRPSVKEVFDLLVAGKDKIDIAAALAKSPGTIKNYISHCYAAFDVEGHDSHAKLVAICNKNGYVPMRK